MKNLTAKQSKIANRQQILSEMMPGAISCEYIASVNRQLPNGFTIKTINLNYKGYSYYMTGYKGKESRFFLSCETANIQGLDIHYITL